MNDIAVKVPAPPDSARARMPEQGRFEVSATTSGRPLGRRQSGHGNRRRPGAALNRQGFHLMTPSARCRTLDQPTAAHLAVS